MNGKRVITGRMVLIGVLAFFAVVFAANGALVFYALDSWPGLAADHAYADGLAYNRVLATARQQRSRGWVSTLTVDGRDGKIAVRIAAPGDTPVEGLQTRVTFRRPLGDERQRTVSLAERAPGIYVADAALPMAGRWYGVVEADRDGQAVFRMEHELMVKP